LNHLSRRRRAMSPIYDWKNSVPKTTISFHTAKSSFSIDTSFSSLGFMRLLGTGKEGFNAHKSGQSAIITTG